MISLGPGSSVLILGAGSDIARAIAHELAARGCKLLLAGRDTADLDLAAADLRLRHGGAAKVIEFDALRFESHAEFFSTCLRESDGNLDGVIICHGILASQQEAQRDAELVRRMIDTNFTSAASILNLSADYFESKRGGFICALSSVAGDRGRQSNYLYGSTKAALDACMQGLGQRLVKCGTTVLIVKPGFVDTAMTWGLPGMFLVASPEKVARDICRAIQQRRSVIYTPWFWRWIMMIIRFIPEPLFRRMKL